MDRRAFLAAASLTTACAPSSPYRSLTLAEARTLAALCDVIVPADDSPSASQVGVVRFIDRQLARRYRIHRETYRNGIAELDRRAQGDFAALPPSRREEIAAELDRGKSPFFTLVVTHTMQGYYASPRHGGNREFASWRMLGVPVSPARGRA